MWSELLDNNLLEDERAVIDVLEAVQRTLVLLGNANELISQTRCAILKCVDHNLEKYGKDPPKNNGDLIGSKEFCAQLKSQVESDKALSQVVTWPITTSPMTSLASQPWVIAENSFSAKALLTSGGPNRTTPSPQANSPRNQSLDTNPVGLPTIYWPNWGILNTSYTTCVPAGAWIEHEPPSSTRSMPVTGRTALFLENWGQLTQDPWVLSTVAGYQLPLNCWPERHSAGFPQSGKEQDMLLEEVVKLVDKGAVHWISAPEADVTSLPFPRVGGGGLEANNRFKIPQCIYDTTTFQDGGIIHATQHHKSQMDYGKVGPQGCLPDSPYCKGVLESPSLSSKLVHPHAVPLPAFWTLYCTFCVFQGHKAHRTVPEAVRYTPYCIFRRPFARSPIQRSAATEPLHSNLVVHKPGVPDKHPKICHNPIPLPGVPRLHGGHRIHDHFLANSQGPDDTEGSSAAPTPRANDSEGSGTNDWDVSSYQACSPYRSPALPCPSGSEDSGTLSSPILSETCTAHPGSSQISSGG